MAINVQIQDRLARIYMSGSFNFGVHHDFKIAYTSSLANVTVRDIEIEMSKVDYMDCAALGMLMLLNERAKDAKKTVTLLNASSVVAQMLEIANFNKIFNIRKAA